jgi:hypothetical protein
VFFLGDFFKFSGDERTKAYSEKCVSSYFTGPCRKTPRLSRFINLESLMLEKMSGSVSAVPDRDNGAVRGFFDPDSHQVPLRTFGL